MFKSVVFDIGRTLIGYDKPLNWASLYRPALEHISDTFGYNFSGFRADKALFLFLFSERRIRLPRSRIHFKNALQ